MTIQFSPVLDAHARGNDAFSIKALNLSQLAELGCPMLAVDEFRACGTPFPPHPHAGFSAVTYVFEDSQSGLRSRTSLGDDVAIGPGGIVWTEAGRGVIHHELPAEANRELHGLQIFVNLSARNKLVAPRMLRLASEEVPEWRSAAGDSVRVVVGSFEALSSPLMPAEPFTLLDAQLSRATSFNLPEDYFTLVYVLGGSILIRAGERRQKVTEGRGIALYGGTGQAIFNCLEAAHFVLLMGNAIHEPVVIDGPFVMNARSEIEGAAERYRSGAMGELASI